jgi:hypothetical protein
MASQDPDGDLPYLFASSQAGSDYVPEPSQLDEIQVTREQRSKRKAEAEVLRSFSPRTTGYRTLEKIQEYCVNIYL